jgi:hypothetical protein
MKITRDTIFISHATPEDSPFTEWLYAQLILAGYKCWCDLDGLYGGERDFSEEIEKVIRDKACKFLLVFSNYTFTKDFVKDEYEYAKSVAKQFGLTDFIFPLRIAEVSFNTRIGLNRYNHFHFFPSWPKGLSKLLKRLYRDQIPCLPDKKSQIISSWVKNKFAIESGIYLKERNYYSNWWQIPSLPDKIYVFQYLNESQAQAVIEEDTVYPKIRHGNCVVAFQRNMISICSKHQDMEVLPTHTYLINLNDILNGVIKDEFPTTVDASNFLKRLLKKSLKDMAFRSGLSRHKLSGKQDCFFYKTDQTKARRVKAEYPGRKTTRTLYGRFGTNTWHFGMSFKVLLEPFISFSLKSHLIFSYNGLKKWEDDDVMFKARRRKGRTMFNREWRDFLMVMLSSLKDEEGKIWLVFTDEYLVELLPYTISFEADFDYDEPTKLSRISLLSDDFEDEEVEEFIETEVNSQDENDDE